MGNFRWWYVLNPQCIVLALVILGVIYCLWKGYGVSSKKFEFQGLGFRDVSWPVKKKKRRPKLNKHEERCREIFQEYFQQKFKSVRPDWLKNPATGKNLELDGYCSHIKTRIGKGLAFEYDGEQHAKYNKHFHGNDKKKFVYQVKRDEWKDLRCKEKGVVLIRIPHFVSFQDLERYITEKLRKNGLNRPSSLHGLYD